jgi:hypothetical protein
VNENARYWKRTSARLSSLAVQGWLAASALSDDAAFRAHARRNASKAADKTMQLWREANQ